MGRAGAAAGRGGAQRRPGGRDRDALPAGSAYRGFFEPSLRAGCGKEEAIYLQADVDARLCRGIDYALSGT